MITERARAKVNLYLHVIGRLADGYHTLDSLAVFPDAADVLTAEAAVALSLAVTGPLAPALANEADNLVLRAGRALARAYGVRTGARLTLDKRLPVASGIGGGSADAAAALRALNRLWGLGASEAALRAVAAPLGADVPVCIASRPARMGGIGEVIAAAPALPPMGIVLANPGVPIATLDVFRARTGGFGAEAGMPGRFADAAAFAAFLAGTANDLQAAACGLCPAIQATLAALRATEGVLLARMSGSGATCFALYPDAAMARHAAAALPGWVWAGPLEPDEPGAEPGPKSGPKSGPKPGARAARGADARSAGW